MPDLKSPSGTGKSELISCNLSLALVVVFDAGSKLHQPDLADAARVVLTALSRVCS